MDIRVQDLVHCKVIKSKAKERKKTQHIVAQEIKRQILVRSGEELPFYYVGSEEVQEGSLDIQINQGD